MPNIRPPNYPIPPPTPSDPDSCCMTEEERDKLNQAFAASKPTFRIVTADTILTGADLNSIVFADSDDDIVITLPQHSTEDVGDFACSVVRRGAGNVDFEVEGSDVLEALGTRIADTNVGVTVARITAGFWGLYGNLIDGSGGGGDGDTSCARLADPFGDYSEMALPFLYRDSFSYFSRINIDWSAAESFLQEYGLGSPENAAANHAVVIASVNVPAEGESCRLVKVTLDQSDPFLFFGFRQDGVDVSPDINDFEIPEDGYVFKVLLHGVDGVITTVTVTPELPI